MRVAKWIKEYGETKEPSIEKAWPKDENTQKLARPQVPIGWVTKSVYIQTEAFS